MDHAQIWPLNTKMWYEFGNEQVSSQYLEYESAKSFGIHTTCKYKPVDPYKIMTPV